MGRYDNFKAYLKNMISYGLDMDEWVAHQSESDRATATGELDTIVKDTEFVRPPTYADATARDAAIPSPTGGLVQWTEDIYVLGIYNSNASAWGQAAVFHANCMTGATGSDTVAAGPGAGQSSDGGTNVFFGNLAGAYTDSAYMTCLGSEAGRSSSNTHYLVALGFKAGRTFTGAAGVLLGENAGSAGSGTYVNAIGYDAGKGCAASYVDVVGQKAAQQAQGDYICGIGNDVGMNSYGSNIAAFDNNAGRGCTGSYCFLGGEDAGYYQLGDYGQDASKIVAIGRGAFNGWTDDSGNAVNFDDSNVSGNVITITNHGLEDLSDEKGVGDYIWLKFTEGSGACGDLTDGDYYVAEITSDDTITLQTTIGTVASETGHTLTPREIYDNSAALGNAAEPDASNQVVLGDTNVTQVKTSGAYIPGKMAESAAANNSLFYNTDDSCLSYKDPGGSVTNLT